MSVLFRYDETVPVMGEKFRVSWILGRISEEGRGNFKSYYIQVEIKGDAPEKMYCIHVGRSASGEYRELSKMRPGELAVEFEDRVREIAACIGDVAIPYIVAKMALQQVVAIRTAGREIGHNV